MNFDIVFIIFETFCILHYVLNIIKSSYEKEIEIFKFKKMQEEEGF